MATNISKNPPPISLDCQPIIVELQTDQVEMSLNRSSLELCPSGFVTSYETINIAWSDQSVQFEFVQTPDDSGCQMEFGNLGNELLATQMVNDLLSNADIMCDFDVELTNNDAGFFCATLRHKSCDAVEIIASTSSTSIDLTINNSSGAYLEDNLSAYLKLYAVDKEGNKEEPIDLHANYDAKTGKACFDLSKLFCVNYELPSTSTITNQFSGASMAPANDTTRDFYFQYADRYGNPAKIRKLQKSSMFHVLRGAETGDFSSPVQNVGNYLVAHLNYNCFLTGLDSGIPPCKIVSKEQPDWVYFYSKFEEKITVDVQVTFSDCTEMVYEIRTLKDIDIDRYCMFSFPSGYTQLKLETLASRDDIVCYTLLFKNTSGTIVHSICYELDCCNPWNCYLIFENGLGGMETWNFRGNKIANYSSTKEVIQKTVSKTYNSSVVEGVFDTYNHQGRHSWELNTGWYSDPAVVQNLRQLILGNAYIVDVDRQRFKKVIIETSELKSIEQCDETLFSYNLTISAAWLDCVFRC